MLNKRAKIQKRNSILFMTNTKIFFKRVEKDMGPIF